MRVFLRFAFLILFLATACSPLLTTEIVEESKILPTTVKPTPCFTSSVFPSATTPLIQTSTVSITPSPQMSTNDELPIEKRCLESEAPFSEMGLSSSSYLIVLPITDNTRTQWSLLGGNLSIKPIPHDISPDGHHYFGDISPDQHWFSFSVEKETMDGYLLDVWISSIDGITQWLGLENLESGTSVRWINEQTMVVIYYASDYPWPSVVGFFNPFLLDEIEFTPTEEIALDQGIYAFSPDGTQIIFLLQSHPFTRWQVYNFQTEMQETIFHWRKDDIGLPFYASVNWTKSGISVALMDENRLHLLVNQKPDLLKEESNIDFFIIPFPKPAIWWRILWWSSDNGLLAFERELGDLSSYEHTNKVKFFILDTTRLILYDYCFQDNRPGYFYESADGRFVSWNVYGENGIEGIFVMELATGKRAWIPAIEVLGWGEFDLESETKP